MNIKIQPGANFREMLQLIFAGSYYLHYALLLYKTWICGDNKPFKFRENISDNRSPFDVLFHSATLFKQTKQVVILRYIKSFAQLSYNLNGVACH